MKIKPLGGYLVVAVQEPTDRTKSGIHLPQSAAEAGHVRVGVVEGVGPGNPELDEPLSSRIREGQTVLFRAHSGDRLPEEYGTRRVILREDDLLAVVDE